MLYFTTQLISCMDPIKYIFEKPALTMKISHWQMLLSEFAIVFVKRKVIKGQAIVDYLADQPLNDLEFLESLFPNEDVMALESEPDSVELWRWKLYFDGATNSIGNGVGAVLVYSKGQQIPMLVKLNFGCTNNVTEYEACIVGLQVSLEFGAYDLSVFGDSLLIISQIKGKWQARDAKLIPYQKCISRLISKFRNITFAYLPRAHNQFADALATLASMVKLLEGDDMWQLSIEVCGVLANCMNIEECMSVEVKLTKSHGTMISRLISRIVNTHPMQQTMKGSLSHTWPANFS